MSVREAIGLAVMTAMLCSCAPKAANLNSSSLAIGSESALSSISASANAVASDPVPTEIKTAALQTLQRLRASVFEVDRLAARAAGMRLTGQEAAEVEATLAAFYRHIESEASLPAPVLASEEYVQRSPEAERALEELQWLLR